MSDEFHRVQPFSNCTTRQNTKHSRQLSWAFEERNVCYGANRPNRVTNGLQAPRARISVNAYGVMLRYARFVNFNPSVRALAARVSKRSCI